MVVDTLALTAAAASAAAAAVAMFPSLLSATLVFLLGSPSPFISKADSEVSSSFDDSSSYEQSSTLFS